MNDEHSMFLDNLKKDLIGNVTAVVVLTGFLRGNPSAAAWDADIRCFLSENMEPIRDLVRIVLSAAQSNSLLEETLATIADLDPQEDCYYDPATVNALLSLYAGSSAMQRFWEPPSKSIQVSFRPLFENKVRDLVSAVLWSRVEAYEREAPNIPPLDLAAIYAAALALIPAHYHGDIQPPEAWLLQVAKNWRQSEATERALRLTGGAPSGLTRVLSELAT